MEREQIGDMIRRSEGESDVKLTAMMRHMDVIASDLRGDMKALTSKVDIVQASTVGIRSTVVTTVLTTAIASVLAIVIGIGGLVLTAASLGDAMFGRGMSSCDAIVAISKEQADKSREALDKAAEELRAARTAKTPAQ